MVATPPQTFDPVAYQALVQKYLAQMNAASGVTPEKLAEVQAEGEAAAEQGNSTTAQAAKMATNIAAKQAGKYLAGQLAGDAAVGSGAYLGGVGATAAGQAAVGAAAADAAGIGTASSLGYSSGALEALAAQQATGTLAAEGAAASGSAAAGGASGTGAGAGSAGYGSYVWPVAAAVTAYQSAKNYGAAKKASKGSGGMTDEELATIYDPWHSAVKKYLPKEVDKPAHEIMKYDPLPMTLKALFGSTKGKDQLMRDRFRNTTLRDIGAIGPDKNQWDLTLADNSKFDVGRDGKNPAKLYNIDMSNPVNAEVTTRAGLLSALMSGGNHKTITDWGATFGNAAVSNAGGSVDKATDNLRAAVASKLQAKGIDANAAQARLDEMYNGGKGSITQSEHDVWASKIPLLFQAPAAATPMRSKTRSPGIDKQGRRIKY